MSPKFGRTGVVRRRRVTFASMMVAAFVIPAAIAYACNPQAHISVSQTGSSISVYGSYFPPNVNVTVYPSWSAPVAIKTSPGGGFGTKLQTPSTPGTYTVKATRATGGFAPASFTVAAAPQPQAPAQSQSQAPAAEKPSTPAASAPTTESKTAPAFKSPGVSRSDAPAAAERSTPPSGKGETTAGDTPNSAGSGNAAGSTTSASGQQVFSGSTAPAAATPTFTTEAPAARTSSKSSKGGSTSTAVAPSQTAALSDLFSDYQPGRTPSLTGSSSGAPAGGAGSGLGLGIGLLAFGLLALVAGLAAAEVRRRRPA